MTGTALRPPRPRLPRCLTSWLPRSLARRLPSPAGLLLFVLTEVLLVDAGGLSAAVVLAATAAAGTALVVCAGITARAVPAVPHQRVRTAIRDREHRTAFLPQRDPDASGRTRPRAPGRRLPTAA